MADPARLDEAGRILGRVTAGPSRLDRGGRRASSPAAGGARQLAGVIGGLADAAIAVDEIGLRRPTLDEVFLALTRDGDGNGATSTTGTAIKNGSSR